MPNKLALELVESVSYELMKLAGPDGNQTLYDKEGAWLLELWGVVKRGLSNLRGSFHDLSEEYRKHLQRGDHYIKVLDALYGPKDGTSDH